ncbi:MAG: hypothetical protein LBM73_02375 [Candidatus Nomurabacteria bacterium]|jgi:hypothetical protein|nr:hypothetical protein [Candidatus Nomurabacteria bacterium]
MNQPPKTPEREGCLDVYELLDNEVKRLEKLLKGSGARDDSDGLLRLKELLKECSIGANAEISHYPTDAVRIPDNDPLSRFTYFPAHYAIDGIEEATYDNSRLCLLYLSPDGVFIRIPNQPEPGKQPLEIDYDYGCDDFSPYAELSKLVYRRHQSYCCRQFPGPVPEWDELL